MAKIGYGFSSKGEVSSIKIWGHVWGGGGQFLEGKSPPACIPPPPNTHKFYMYMMYMYTVKRHFYAGDKIMRICQNGPLDKFMHFLFMCSSVLCIETYGTIKIMWCKFMQPSLDSHTCNSHKQISYRNLSLYGIYTVPDRLLISLAALQKSLPPHFAEASE